MVDPDNGSEKPSQIPNGGSEKKTAKDNSFESPLILNNNLQVGKTLDEPETPSGQDSRTTAPDTDSILLLHAVKPEPETSITTENTSKQDGGTEPQKNSPPSPVHSKQYGVWMFLLGGVFFAATGFGTAFALSYYGILRAPGHSQQLIEEKLAAQTGEINALRTEMAGIFVDPNPMSDRLSDAMASIESLSGRFAENDASLQKFEDLTTRVSTVEATLELLENRFRENANQPIPEVPLPVGISDNAREITLLREELELAISELTFVKNQIGAIKIEESQPAQNNPDVDGINPKKAAIIRALAAIDTGSSLDAALGDMEAAGLEVPEKLYNISKSGIISIAEISDDFPDAARNALSEIRKAATESGGFDGLSAFLSNMVNIRSLAPREGSDPDAILSRAEHAVKTGRLQDALTEIEKLPAEGLLEFSIWIENLSRRLEAIALIQSMDEIPDR